MVCKESIWRNRLAARSFSRFLLVLTHLRVSSSSSASPKVAPTSLRCSSRLFRFLKEMRNTVVRVNILYLGMDIGSSDMDYLCIDHLLFYSCSNLTVGRFSQSDTTLAHSRSRNTHFLRFTASSCSLRAVKLSAASFSLVSTGAPSSTSGFRPRLIRILLVSSRESDDSMLT